MLENTSHAFFESFTGHLIEIALLFRDEAGLELGYYTHVNIYNVEVTHKLYKLVILCFVRLRHRLDELVHALSFVG